MNNLQCACLHAIKATEVTAAGRWDGFSNRDVGDGGCDSGGGGFDSSGGGFDSGGGGFDSSGGGFDRDGGGCDIDVVAVTATVALVVKTAKSALATRPALESLESRTVALFSWLQILPKEEGRLWRLTIYQSDGFLYSRSLCFPFLLYYIAVFFM